jgi:hypothetical protein
MYFFAKKYIDNVLGLIVSFSLIYSKFYFFFPKRKAVFVLHFAHKPMFVKSILCF